MRALCLAAGMALFATAARAVPTCSITASPMTFGVYNPFSAAPLDAAGTLDVKCPGVLRPAQITLDRGGSSTYQPRRMVAGGAIADLLFYNLYRDAGRSSVWGDGTEGTATYTQPRAGASAVLPLYGRVFALQDVSVGTYTDNVVVVIIF